jgi:drug/metabolite transporter (DMT)-like permease
VVLATGGLACVVEVWSGLRFDLTGLSLALVAACCQAGYFLLGDHGSVAGDQAPDPLGVIAYGLLVATALLTVVARPWAMDWTLLGSTARMNGTAVPAAVLIGWIVLITTVVAYITGITAVRRLSPQVAGVVSCLEAVVATVLAWFLLGEHLSAIQLVGGTVVLLGALIAQSATPGRSAPEPVTRGYPDAPAATVRLDAAGPAAGPSEPPERPQRLPARRHRT